VNIQMARTLNRLSVLKVASIKTAGRYADGGGLYFRVTPGGSRSWVFMTTSDGKRSEIGLGPASAVSLSSARQLASQMRDAIALGTDPRAVIATTAEPAPTAVPTFAAFADDYITSVEEDGTATFIGSNGATACCSMPLGSEASRSTRSTPTTY
jgi:hypothetical protein